MVSVVASAENCDTGGRGRTQNQVKCNTDNWPPSPVSQFSGIFSWGQTDANIEFSGHKNLFLDTHIILDELESNKQFVQKLDFSGEPSFLDQDKLRFAGWPLPEIKM